MLGSMKKKLIAILGVATILVLFAFYFWTTSYMGLMAARAPSYQARLTSVEARLTNIENLLSDLVERVTAIKADIAEIESEVAYGVPTPSIEDKLSSIEQEISRMEEELAGLTKEVSGFAALTQFAPLTSTLSIFVMGIVAAFTAFYLSRRYLGL